MPPTDRSPAHLAQIGWRGPAATLPSPPGRLARVIAQHRAGYVLHDGEVTFAAQPAARFLRRGLDPELRPAVGDFVAVLAGRPPAIEAVLPRRTVLRRGAAGENHQRQVIATNVDVVLILTGLDGDFNPARIERYLLLVAGSGAEAFVVLTKADRVADAPARVAELAARLPATRILAVNAKSVESVAPLAAELGPGRTGVLVGSSGAGKSTLTNTLLGARRQATAAVREHDSRGRHTTTHRALVTLPGGGCLIDTPGMRELRLTGEESLDAGQFDDIDQLAAECRFGDCAHASEPGCAVQAALDAGELDPARWRNYLKLRTELAATAEALEAQLRRRSEGRPSLHAPGRPPRNR